MIGNNHIELDGIRYDLAEDAEGSHHRITEEPLRPPNAVTVQGGDGGQKFQMRPDTLLWTWTDWSEGEGQRIYDPQAPGRAWQLNGVRAFEEPGNLIPGYYVETTQDSTGAADFSDVGPMSVGDGKLWVSDTGSTDDMYYWDTTKWSAAQSMGALAQGRRVGKPGMVGDGQNVFFHENTVAPVYKWDGSTRTALGNGQGQVTTVMTITEDYVYSIQPGGNGGSCIEVPKDGSAATTIDSWQGTWTSAGAAELDGKVYIPLVADNYTVVRQITPTSAAGAGYGRTFTTIQGFIAEYIWAHAGKLFLIGSFKTAQDRRTILYLQPGQTYGSLGELRPGVDLGVVASAGQRMLDHFFVVETLGAGVSDTQAVFQVDSVSGGIACVAYDETDDPDAGPINAGAAFEGDVFWGAGSATRRVLRADPDRYQINSSAISPSHDFDLVSDKFLSSLVLRTKALPADWTVYVDYQLDDDGTWTNAITYSTTSGRGTEAVITTDSTTVEFSRLQMRIRFAYTGGGVPSSAPTVTGVEARAVVAEKVKVFRYLINLMDDHSAGQNSFSGAKKVINFLASAAKKTALDLKDGYVSSRPGVFNQYDVTVDSSDVVLDRPGEGIGQITLREVT